jgi:Zn finger protein HypA/HybF involved in hydrogenase expression
MEALKQFITIVQDRYAEVEDLKRQPARRWCPACREMLDFSLRRDRLSHRYFRQCPKCGALQGAE